MFVEKPGSFLGVGDVFGAGRLNAHTSPCADTSAPRLKPNASAAWLTFP